uniref:Uncharacterized protein n=1 Tax=Siphoviridae sp. ct1is2 TaxID=2826273 RepID=A0A8S5NNQ2_9CAUD|nr:MAG TPA: hypothetical protein [Siphoviridae sp. ct1is2]DAL89332.1 MAG TPA: hypothetical protein [Caudoviricetes sp.]DAP21946.1 MAG TPA: hypothetical protein [Caudoviricetes sp.]
MQALQSLVCQAMRTCFSYTFYPFSSISLF